MNWQELASAINTMPGHQILRIGFVSGDHLGIMRYERALIQRAVFHEDLFSMFLGWEAGFYPFQNQWIWQNPPKNNKEVVQVIDLNVEIMSPLPHNMPDGIIYKIFYVLWNKIPDGIEIDPLTNLTRKGTTTLNFMETGWWIIPPTCPKLLLNSNTIRKIDD